MNETLAILGAGGHGKVVADAAFLGSDFSEVIFFDDAYPVKTTNGRWLVVGTGGDLLSRSNEFAGVVVAIGSNRLRLEKTVELEAAGAKVVSVVHPSAVVSSFATIAAGCVVFGGAVINVDVVIDSAVIVNTGAVIEHDCELKSGVHISPNAALAGQTVVGVCSWVGIGAVTKQLVTIGKDVVVGAGAVVIDDIQDNLVVVGSPAREKFNTAGGPSIL